MKRVIATVGALTFLSVGAANAAVASYNFESATLGSISTASFGGALTPLGITSSAITPGTGNMGVVNNLMINNGIVGANATINYGAKSFSVGNNGSWELIFGNNGTTAGTTRFDFVYNETESSGFDVVYYALNGTTVLNTVNVRPSGTASQQCEFASTCAAVNYTNVAGIGRVVFTDLGNDNFNVDNLTVDTIAVVSSPVPEPSTYAMIGTALAGLAFFRRRRA